MTKHLNKIEKEKIERKIRNMRSTDNLEQFWEAHANNKEVGNFIFKRWPQFIDKMGYEPPILDFIQGLSVKPEVINSKTIPDDMIIRAFEYYPPSLSGLNHTRINDRLFYYFIEDLPKCRSIARILFKAANRFPESDEVKIKLILTFNMKKDVANNKWMNTP